MRHFFRRSPCASLAAGLLVLFVLVIPASVRAQAEQQKFGFGTHALRRMLYETKFQALEEWGDLHKDPRHTLLVLLGGSRTLGRITDGLEAFLDRGGAVLLATDQAIDPETRAGRELMQVAGTVVSGFAVSASPPAKPTFAHWVQATRVNPKAIYHLPECILVTPTLEGSPLFVPRTAALPAESGLTTNRPSYLLDLPLPEHVQRVAVFPKGCRYDSPAGPVYLGLFQPTRTFAVRSELNSGGRLLLLADHSIFINEMMLKSDTSNVDFAYNAIDWLKGDNKERDRVLFVYDGQIETKLDVPIRENQVSMLDAQASLVNHGNEMLKEIEAKHPWEAADQETILAIGQASRNLFEKDVNQAALRAFAQAPRRARLAWLRPRFYRLLIVLGVLGAFFYGLSRLRRASFRAEPHVPLFAAAASRHAPSASILLQRYRHAVQEDNLGDYAHVLAQEWLGTVYTGEGPPRVVDRGDGSPRRSLRKLVERIWRMAQADVPERMSQREFRAFLADLENLRLALATGDLHLE